VNETPDGNVTSRFAAGRSILGGMREALEGLGSGPSRGHLPPGSAERRWSEGHFSSGGGRESPPGSERR
jgi:hypothetical protein